jgi:hypothetical protein
MKKLFLYFLILFSTIILSTPTYSRQPKYKALFNLFSDMNYYRYTGYKSPFTWNVILLISVADKRPDHNRKLTTKVVNIFTMTSAPKHLSKCLGKCF